MPHLLVVTREKVKQALESPQRWVFSQKNRHFLPKGHCSPDSLSPIQLCSFSIAYISSNRRTCACLESACGLQSLYTWVVIKSIKSSSAMIPSAFRMCKLPQAASLLLSIKLSLSPPVQWIEIKGSIFLPRNLLHSCVLYFLAGASYALDQLCIRLQKWGLSQDPMLGCRQE